MMIHCYDFYFPTKYSVVSSAQIWFPDWLIFWQAFEVINNL